MNPSIRRAGDDEFRVRAEAAVDGEAFVVEVTRERLHGVAVEGVDISHRVSVRREQDGLSVGAETKAGPLARRLAGKFEAGERSWKCRS